jgi:hypothetical protein
MNKKANARMIAYAALIISRADGFWAPSRRQHALALPFKIVRPKFHNVPPDFVGCGKGG